MPDSVCKTLNNKIMNPRQLTFVREYKGYSQTELASHIQGLSQSNLSKFEKGIGLLSTDIIQKIVDFLGFPTSFYDQVISNNIDNAHYRKKAGVTKKEKDYIEKSIKLIGYIIDQMSESIEFPTFSLKTIDISEGFSPVYAAQFIRRSMGILQGPVNNICSKLESFGIIIVQVYDCDEGFDGVSFLTDLGYPVIVINGNYSNDRKRLTIAHELGHIVLHISPDIVIPNWRDKEKEAYSFAAEFLMPSDEIKSSLTALRLSYLLPLKQYWLTSMASIVHRAKDLGTISADKYKYLNVELSRKGYKKNEPGNVNIDTPSLFYEAYQLYKTELHYTDLELSQIFHLPINVIQHFCIRRAAHLHIVKR